MALGRVCRCRLCSGGPAEPGELRGSGGQSCFGDDVGEVTQEKIHHG